MFVKCFSVWPISDNTGACLSHRTIGRMWWIYRNRR
uniref:Uncharacterized protein n=1 Tax=Ascaris lumbricoides TaxID=6252 RepID=A0A0M3IPB3_ASCLU